MISKRKLAALLPSFLIASVTLMVGEVVAPLAATAQAVRVTAKQDTTRLDAAVTQVLAKHFKKNGPGAAVLIAYHGQVKLKKCYGLANIATAQPITGQSLFDLASMSKEFTAAAILLLISDGKLALNERVDKVLPDYHVPIKGRAVTVGDLIYHISGLADYSDDDEWQGKEAQFRRLTPTTMLRWLNGTTSLRTPGTRWEYDNTGYALLALIIERTSMMSYAQFVQSRLFAPAGMSSTVVHDKLALHLTLPNLVTGYKREGAKVSKASRWTQITGDGNILTTIDDMARWDKALCGDTILDARQRQLAWSSGHLDNHKSIEVDGSGYGFGWNVDTANANIFHNGAWDGTSTYIIRHLDTGLTVVVLSNDENADANDIGTEIENVLTP